VPHFQGRFDKIRQEVILMAVKQVGEYYHCNICGNEVRVTKVGGGILFCCGQEMQLLGSHEQKPVDDELPV